jgi:hypothetical protein
VRLEANRPFGPDLKFPMLVLLRKRWKFSARYSPHALEDSGSAFFTTVAPAATRPGVDS